MSRRACASAGVIVFGVVPVWPAQRPWRLSVVSNVSASSAARPSRPPMKVSIPASWRMSSSQARSWAARTASCVGVGARLPASRPAIAGRPSASQNVASAATSRCPAFGEHDAPARVGVNLHGAQMELDDDDALAAAIDVRPPREVEPAAFDQRGIRLAELRTQVEQRVERSATGLLLALDEEPNAAGQRANGLEPGLDGPQRAAGTRPCCRSRRARRRARPGSPVRTAGSSTGRAARPAGRRSAGRR